MSAFVQSLFQFAIYKRSQGRIARQITFAVLAVAVGIGCWRLSQFLVGDPFSRFVVPGVIVLLGWWISYRLVNFSQFADFLISVEAEMNKVSWPGRSELFRSVLVVMFTIFFLAALLALYDFLWWLLLTFLQVLQPAKQLADALVLALAGANA